MPLRREVPLVPMALIGTIKDVPQLGDATDQKQDHRDEELQHRHLLILGMLDQYQDAITNGMYRSRLIGYLLLTDTRHPDADLFVWPENPFSDDSPVSDDIELLVSKGLVHRSKTYSYDGTEYRMYRIEPQGRQRIEDVVDPSPELENAVKAGVDVIDEHQKTPVSNLLNTAVNESTQYNELDLLFR